MSQFKKSFERFLLSIPRSIAPVLTLGSRTFIFRDADVREILLRDKDFTLGEVNYESIARHIGPFILGMDDGPDYQRDKAILRGIIRKDDPERIRKYVRKTAQQLIDGFQGRIDLVSAYTRKIPLLLVGDYFGVPGPNPEDMLRWNRSLFWDVFLDLSGKPEIREAANQSAQEMNAYLEELINTHKDVVNLKRGRLADNLLNRLITLQGSEQPSFDDPAIRGNIAGVFLGALEPTNKAVCNALGQIYARPNVLSQARAAAARDDVDAVAKIAWEALRFHPNAPLLMRYARTEQSIGGGDRKKRRIKAGKTLFVMTQSAMFDPRVVEAPKQFKTDRQPDRYLYFGLGLHTCYGNYVNFVCIPEMLTALLKIEGLRPRGKVVNEGPFPDSWEFEVS